MKQLVFFVILLFIYSCEKSVTSEAVNTANPVYPIVLSAIVDADTSIVHWTKKNSFDPGTDTLIGSDTLSWSAMYNNGTEVHLSVEAVNGKAEVFIYRYFDTVTKELVSTASDSSANVSLDILYNIPE